MNKIEYENNLIHGVIESIESHGGKDILSSIILTGSFGRNEPTYTINSFGDVELKSDVEIALVFPNGVPKDKVNDLINHVTKEFNEDLNLMPISEKRVKNAYNFNFSIRVPKYKTIFTYDLFNGSRTIWGHDFIGEMNIGLEQVDLYEAKRLVANRIGELIYLQNESNENVNYLRVQWKGKLLLAIGSAWLICEKEYISSYHGQYKKIISLRSKVEETFGSTFIDDYSKIFNFLRESGDEYEVPDDRMVNYVKNVNKIFFEKSINIPKVNSFSRNLKYYLKYVKTGMKYGQKGFEDNILQALITDYINRSSRLSQDADVWHRVIY